MYVCIVMVGTAQLLMWFGNIEWNKFQNQLPSFAAAGSLSKAVMPRPPPLTASFPDIIRSVINAFIPGTIMKRPALVVTGVHIDGSVLVTVMLAAGMFRRRILTYERRGWRQLVVGGVKCLRRRGTAAGETGRWAAKLLRLGFHLGPGATKW